MCITKINSITLYQSELLKEIDGLIHGFTTRQGGVSKGEYESLSLSHMRGDDLSCVQENRKILCRELSLNYEKLTSTRQEHTDNIKIIDKNSVGCGIQTEWDEGVDGIITQEKNVPLICYSADCVPILFYASDIKAIGAVHSGWRGTKEKIAEKAVIKLKELGAKGENIFAAIGPCIGKCCYEVSEDVALNFEEKSYTKKENGKFMLDLADVNTDILKNAGVKNITISGICTKCNNDMFFSHRGQNGKSGTLGGIICMR